MNQIVLQNVSSRTREKDIRDVYEKYGDIKEINLKYRKATIEYKEEESAEEAYQKTNMILIAGRNVTVRHALSVSRSQSRQASKREKDSQESDYKRHKRHSRERIRYSRSNSRRRHNRSNSYRNNRDTRECYKCHQVGHLSFNCQKKSEYMIGRCYQCGQKGHKKQDCDDNNTRRRSHSRHNNKSESKRRRRRSVSKSQ